MAKKASQARRGPSKAALLAQLRDLYKRYTALQLERDAVLEALVEHLCPYSVGQVLRWGGYSQTGSPAIVEDVTLCTSSQGNPYWLLRAKLLKKDRTRGKVAVKAYQGMWHEDIAVELVDDRTAVQVKNDVNERRPRGRLKL